MASQVEDAKAPLTVRNYRDWLRQFFQWLGDRDPLAATTEDLHGHLAGVWPEIENPHTRFSRVKALKVFYGWLARKSLVTSNPAQVLKTPRTPDQVPYVLRADVYGVLDIDDLQIIYNEKIGGEINPLIEKAVLAETAKTRQIAAKA